MNDPCVNVIDATEIVALNERMVESLSRGDLSVLERVMAPEARVNGPNNKVATGHQILERFRKGELAHSEYDRKIEEACVSDAVVVLMGEEVVERTRRQAKILGTGYSTPERTDRAYFTKIRN